MSILVVARAIPIVLMNNLIRSFCSANTCSTRARIFDFALLARCIVSGIARPFGFLRWMWLTKPFLVRNVSLAADRYAVSAHTPLAVLFLSSKSRGLSRIDRKALARSYGGALGACHRSPAGDAGGAASLRVLGGSYRMAARPNQAGGGDHVANCGYITDPA